jgi:predicted transcriptional regulator
MVKTTVYLENDLALALRQLAALEGRSQAELIRQAVSTYARRGKRPSIPGAGEFDSGETKVSERAEDILKKASDKKWRRTSSHGAHR